MPRPLALLLGLLFAASASASPIENRAAAKVLVEAGDWSRAAEAYREIIGHDPDHGEDRLYLGQALAKLGRCEELKSAISLGANGNRTGLRLAHVEAARCDAKLGENEDAIVELAAALEAIRAYSNKGG